MKYLIHVIREVKQKMTFEVEGEDAYAAYIAAYVKEKTIDASQWALHGVETTTIQTPIPIATE